MNLASLETFFSATKDGFVLRERLMGEGGAGSEAAAL